jgi:hypothetical protein
MYRFTSLLPFLVVLLAILAPPVIALLPAASIGDPGVPPVAPGIDMFPDLPPLSDLARMPSGEIAAGWYKLQRAVMDELQAKGPDATLPPQLRSRYHRIINEVGDRMIGYNYIIAAHDKSYSERDRRHFLAYLRHRNMQAYETGVYPPPLTFGLMPQKQP